MEIIVGIFKVESKLIKFEEPLGRAKIVRSEMGTRWSDVQKMNCEITRRLSGRQSTPLTTIDRMMSTRTLQRTACERRGSIAVDSRAPRLE
jgi:hypothetical protein